MGLRRLATMAVAITMLAGFGAAAQDQATNLGPYDARFLEGGIGLNREVQNPGTLVDAGVPWSVGGWVRRDRDQRGVVVLAALGDPASGRRLALIDGRPAVLDGEDRVVASRSLPVGEWRHVAAKSDGGRIHIYVDGDHVREGSAVSTAVTPTVSIAPVVPGLTHFGGALVGMRFEGRATPLETIRAWVQARPNFEVVHFWDVGVGWPLQNRANIGLTRPQDPWTLPQGRGATSEPEAIPASDAPAVEAIGPGRWRINQWNLISAQDTVLSAEQLSTAGALGADAFSEGGEGWMAATVPGTVLTTLVDRGVYPDPYYGLNNLQIPESLARQDWWYRTEFTVPAEAAGRRTTLVVGGANYEAEVWINGRRAGEMRGAFTRGQFEFTPVEGDNAVAIRVSPPPHPGVPHEQSIAGGVGENGGAMAIDGPTFVAAEGWDWIPGIRDRNTGLWLPVEMETHGSVRILDPQVITDLPLPATDSADVHVNVPVENLSDQPRPVTVRIAFDGVTVERTETVQPGTTTVRFSPASNSELRIANPELWWPNGYGEPALHQMTITAVEDGRVSDVEPVRFGIREVSYELSLIDSRGVLRRVDARLTDAALRDERIIDNTHEALTETPRGWVSRLTAAGERSPAVHDIPATMPEPHLTIRVNGVPIAARGGNWGMDDAMKRSGRERLEPYFRLQREGNMNIIRNWMGTNTQPSFYELADEYGMMVMSDFWQSTQNFQVEPQDPQLFLANARDTVARYRNHPSIILWFGRNEGVPHPILNEGLADAVAELDAPRWYTGSSNVVNLQGSGPYNYRPPVGYFTDLATGFSVETGTPSLSTLESVQSYVPREDLWPLSDTLAYHDWHFGGNGDTASFMAAMETSFGAPRNFEDFERKAQMMNLETHKAMFEGMLAHLWTRNSGRMLWMTHPAWPSNAWQLYSWDYDTHAAYYGARSATEPVHVQMNLPDNALAVVNTSRNDLRRLSIKTTVLSLDGRELMTRTDNRINAPANQTTTLTPLALAEFYPQWGTVLVFLELSDGQTVLSRNFYWRSASPAGYRSMNGMRPAQLSVTAGPTTVDGGDRVMTVTLTNSGTIPAVNAKLTVLDADGERILPLYYSDNYIAVRPGEARDIEVRWPVSETRAPAALNLRGWNVPAGRVSMAVATAAGAVDDSAPETAEDVGR